MRAMDARIVGAHAMKRSRSSADIVTAKLIGRRDGVRFARTQWKTQVDACRELAGGMCRVCGARGHDSHHIIKRSAGGADLLENLLYVCRTCHDRFDAPYGQGRLIAEWWMPVHSTAHANAEAISGLLPGYTASDGEAILMIWLVWGKNKREIEKRTLLRSWPWLSLVGPWAFTPKGGF